MDVASTILSIVSIVISIALAVVGIWFARQSDITLASVKTQLDAQLNHFMTLIQDERKAQHELMGQLVLKLLETRGDLPKAKAETLEKQLTEVFSLQKQYDTASVLSTQSKVEENETHA